MKKTILIAAVLLLCVIGTQKAQADPGHPQETQSHTEQPVIYHPLLEHAQEKNAEEGKEHLTHLQEGHTHIDISQGAFTEMTRTEDAFYIETISDEVFARIEGRSFKPECTLPREDLRYLHCLHKDLEGQTHEGEMIVNYHIAEDVLDILRQLYEADYPIEKIRLVDEYDAVDEASMADNNSSSFNFRFVSYTTTVSKHGLGLAVDINTLYNPYVKTVNGRLSIEPANAGPYVDRSKDFPYKIDENDLCYKLFAEKGFFWGGHWNNSKDYQHFEIPDAKIREWYPGWRK